MAPNSRVKRVVIIGGGASGMSAAYALSLSPEKFDVTLIEREDHAGGMATSAEIDKSKFGADYINDGVQGASPTFYNTYAMFDTLGFKPTEVGFQVSFGKDPEKDFWSNVFPSPVIDKFQDDIKKFGKVLKVIKKLELVFALMQVRTMLKLFRFSKDFGDVIIYPLVALFFGTGNQTPYISCAILERVFMDPSMRLFEYSPKSFLASIPEMRAFPRLSMVFEAWQRKIESSGSARIILSREVSFVKRDSKEGVTVRSHKTGTGEGEGEREEEREEHFDELIMATDADSALKILGDDAGWLEKKVLGNVKYYSDLTVTHNDIDFMRKYYRVEYEESMASPKAKGSDDPSKPPEDQEGHDQVKFAEKNFAPLYYIRNYPEDKSRVEMSFDLTNYQPQFKGVPPTGPDTTDNDSSSSSSASASSPPAKSTQSLPGEDQEPGLKDKEDLSKHVYQTIFLDHANFSHLWTEGEINPEKIIMKRWWKQQSHAASHYRGTVGAMMFLNGSKHTHFAGAWTVLNMHEIAVVSGFSAAYQLGAPYPFKDDADSKRLFALYLALDHKSRMRKEDRNGFFV